MPTPTLSQELATKAVLEVARAISEGFYYNSPAQPGQRSAIQEVAKRLNIGATAVANRIERAEQLYGITLSDGLSVVSAQKPDEDLAGGLDVLTRHAEFNDKYIANSRKKWQRRIPVPKEPFGIAVLGDMHLDNKGTDLNALHSDLSLLAAAGVRTVNIGDTLDNFQYTGKLAREAAKSRMSDEEGLAVAKWVVRDSGVRFDAHILGNHDAWAGGAYAHLFQEWATDASHRSRFYDWIVKLTYCWEGGEYTLLAAHDFKGHSVRNPLHGLFRRANEDGTADGYVAGHRHNAADASFEDGFRDKRYNFARVGSYKKWDQFGHTKGFPQQKEGAACMFVINPWSETLSGRCTVMPSIPEGLEYLNMKKVNYAA